MTPTEGQTTTEAKGAKPRLSARQREVLETIEANCRPVRLSLREDETVVPVSMWQLGNSFGHCFFYERQFEKFCENLEARGLIRIERKQFIYITDAGKLAVGAKTP